MKNGILFRWIVPPTDPLPNIVEFPPYEIPKLLNPLLGTSFKSAKPEAEELIGIPFHDINVWEARCSSNEGVGSFLHKLLYFVQNFIKTIWIRKVR